MSLHRLCCCSIEPPEPDMVNLWRVDSSTDTLAWAVRLLDNVNGVATGGGVLYALAHDSGETESMLYSINPSTGATLWSVDVFGDDVGYGVRIASAVAADSSGNAYVACIGGVRKYNSSGTLVGTFVPSTIFGSNNAIFGFVSYDASSDVLVGSHFGFPTTIGMGLVKFDTSLTELAATGSEGGTFGIVYYSGETVWDDVWAREAGTDGGWWFAPPADESELPPGYPPSAVGRVTNVWGMSGLGDLLFAVGDTAITLHTEDVGSATYRYISKATGSTDSQPLTLAWDYEFTDFDLSLGSGEGGPIQFGIGAADINGSVLYAGTSISMPPELFEYSRSITTFSESAGTLQKKYRLGNETTLAGANSIKGLSGVIYVGTNLAPMVFAIPS